MSAIDTLERAVEHDADTSFVARTFTISPTWTPTWVEPDFANRPENAPPPNAALLRKTLDYIEAHPAEWDQGSWVSECGTKFCFAGHALHIQGYEPIRDEEFDDYSNYMKDPYTEDEEGVDVLAAATAELGLLPAEAWWLFAHDRSMADIRGAVNVLIGD